MPRRRNESLPACENGRLRARRHVAQLRHCTPLNSAGRAPILRVWPGPNEPQNVMTSIFRLSLGPEKCRHHQVFGPKRVSTKIERQKVARARLSLEVEPGSPYTPMWNVLARKKSVARSGDPTSGKMVNLVSKFHSFFAHARCVAWRCMLNKFCQGVDMISRIPMAHGALKDSKRIRL